MLLAADTRLGPYELLGLIGVAPDGQRFYVTRSQKLPTFPPVTRINLVINWFEELKARLPARRLSLMLPLSSCPRWIARCATTLALGALALPCAAGTQTLYGSVTGTVRDPQRAVLPGAIVTATNAGTGLRLETVTNAAGDFWFRNMPTGVYDLSASLSGFRIVRQAGLIVTAGEPIRLDLVLEITGVSKTVTVNAESSSIQTQKSDLSTELTGQQVVSLPLNQYRNYQSLLAFVPGATPATFQNAEIDTPARSLRTFVNGVHPQSNTTRVDGALSINIWLPHHVAYVQPAETIETVNVVTNSFEADQGMAGGMAQTVITKSGTNQLRGSGFWFVNRDELNANSYYNRRVGLEEPNLDTKIYGGTLGGPIVRNRFFYFAGYEMYRDRRERQATYGVPTARMRQGDFTEVAAVQPNFRLYDPASSATAAGRTPFAGFIIPQSRLSPVAKAIMTLYPEPADRHLNSNLLLDDFVRIEQVRVDRANYDAKLTFQRSPAHSIWGKFSMLNAEVVDYFMLGWDDGSVGVTRVYVGGLGHTWTLSPTLVLDGNLGYNRQDQTVTPPDYGINYGLQFGMPGTNDPNDIWTSGMPRISNGYTLGFPAFPLSRKEITYSFSSALMKVFGGHELRAGFDVVRMALDHRQAELGDGVRGGVTFGGTVTGIPGYAPQQWNRFAEFLLGLPSSYGKDVQTETMTGREWQSALYFRDRWRVTQKLTLNLGLRAESYPLMTRAHSGIERLDYDAFTVILGGRGGQPKDAGIEVKEWYLVPRLGATYRFAEDTVVRAGYGRTINPLPWSRPLRGTFPYDVFFNKTAEQFFWVTTLSDGIPAVSIPDYQSGVVKLPTDVFFRSPNTTDVDRAVIQQWNIALERRLPMGIVTEVAYVGTATDGGYADRNLNYGEPGGGQTTRKYYRVAGTAAITDWAARTRSRYHALQVALNRPFRDGLMLKAAYTLSRARNMTDDDGWTSLLWNHPLMEDENYSLATYDRTHVFHVGLAYDLPFWRNGASLLRRTLGDWQVIGALSAYSGTPFSILGSNTALNCQGCGPIVIDVSGDPKPAGDGGLGNTWYDTSLFSQPTGATKAGFGNSGRNGFRRPPVWDLSMALFKAFRVGRIRPEVRIEAANVLNRVNWGAPMLTFTSPNFMRFIPESTRESNPTTGDIPGQRSVRIGLRVTY